MFAYIRWNHNRGGEKKTYLEEIYAGVNFCVLHVGNIVGVPPPPRASWLYYNNLGWLRLSLTGERTLTKGAAPTLTVPPKGPPPPKKTCKMGRKRRGEKKKGRKNEAAGPHFVHGSGMCSFSEGHAEKMSH